jgi:alkylated DNA repair dioxygenase AlkB
MLGWIVGKIFLVILLLFYFPILILMSALQKRTEMKGGNSDESNHEDKSDSEKEPESDSEKEPEDSQTKEKHKPEPAEIEVYDLNIPDIWKYAVEGWPEEVHADVEDARKRVQNKLWFIKKTIRYKTDHDQMGEKLDKYILPDDLCVVKGVHDDNELEECYEDLEKLFDNYKELGVMASDQRRGRGLLYLFTGDNEETQKYSKTLEFLKEYNPRLLKFVEKYVDKVVDMYNVEGNLDDYIQVIPLKYDSPNGIWIHIDNIARYEQGPIITLGVGPKYTYYDFTPTLLWENSDLKPIRIRVQRGDIVVMDGSARMEWAHGLPYNVPYEKTKYTIMIKCNKLASLNERYNKILDTSFTTSGNVC